MNDSQRLQLQNMIQTNNVEDQTELIRNLKHSVILRNEVNNMIMIKARYRDDPDKINIECMNECGFLFTYYTEIFNKIKKDEIDIGIFKKFIDVLKQIEDGELDQHSGSFMVGTLLKELYIDSALKKANKLNDEREKNKEKEPQQPTLEIKNVSWHEFKRQQMKKTKTK
jgi:hypothetical protein